MTVAKDFTIHTYDVRSVVDKALSGDCVSISSRDRLAPVCEAATSLILRHNAWLWRPIEDCASLFSASVSPISEERTNRSLRPTIVNCLCIEVLFAVCCNAEGLEPRWDVTGSYLHPLGVNIPSTFVRHPISRLYLLITPLISHREVLNVTFTVHTCSCYSSALILHSLCIIKHARNVLLNGFSVEWMWYYILASMGQFLRFQGRSI